VLNQALRAAGGVYSSPAEFYSSPAVGADGTVYVGSIDGYVYALKADGITLKWKYQTAGSVYSSPAVGADGIVYVGSVDGYVYALRADGSDVDRLKWKYQTGEQININLNFIGGKVRSSPAVGADGTVYVGSDTPDGYLYALRADGSDVDRLKWKYRTGGSVESSPAVGADGIVYVGSDDGYVYALKADGRDEDRLKWKYKPGEQIPEWAVRSSPAVGADGTVYVGSMDGYVYALKPEGSDEDRFKWKYQTGGGVYSLPAVGADGIVYVGSVDGYVYALRADGSDVDRLKWKYRTGGSVESSPAVGADGIVYVGSDDGYFYALNADGRDENRLKWKHRTGGGVTSSPAIGADGTVYVGSGDSHLYGFGLSGGLVTSSLHSAQRALARNETESAVSQLQHLCSFTSSVQNPVGADTFTPETVDLVGTSCQLLANTIHSPNYGRAWGSFVTPLSFTEYKRLISTSGTMMSLLQKYEHNLATFEAEETNIEARIDAGKDAVKGYAADEANWQGVSQRDTAAMNAYGTQIVTNGQQMDSKYAVLQTDVLSLIKNLDTQLQNLNKTLVDAKDKDERKKYWAPFKSFYDVVLGGLSTVACFGLAVGTGGAGALACGLETAVVIAGAIGAIKDCVNTLHSRRARSAMSSRPRYRRRRTPSRRSTPSPAWPRRRRRSTHS